MNDWYLTFASCEVYSFPHGFASGWRCTLGLRLVPLLFLYTWSSTIRFTKNYPVEVCPLSRRVTLKPLSAPLQDGIRFFRIPVPASRSAFLTVGLPVFVGEIQVFHVPCKWQREWVRICHSAGSSVVRVTPDWRGLSSLHPFPGLSLSVSFGSFKLTTFSDSSHVLFIPFKPSSRAVWYWRRLFSPHGSNCPFRAGYLVWAA